MGIRDKPIAPASPWQNGYAERLIGSIRRECLDHVIVLGEARRILKSYADYYNRASEHPSVYVVEEKKLCWPLTGPAGCLTVLRARSTIDLPASDASAARAKIQTPSGSG
jgi:transposase InsO family protein